MALPNPETVRIISSAATFADMMGEARAALFTFGWRLHVSMRLRLQPMGYNPWLERVTDGL